MNRNTKRLTDSDGESLLMMVTMATMTTAHI